MIKLKNILFEQKITNDSEFRKEIKAIEGEPPKNKVGNYVAFDDGFGTWTIGWGHTGDVKKGDVITPSKAEELLTNDIAEKVTTAKRKFPKYNSFDIQVKRAIVNALFRGDLGPATSKLINAKSINWNAVADEYLNSNEFKREREKTNQRRKFTGTKKLAQPDTNIFTRMSKNADRFRSAATNTEYIVQSGDTLSSIAAKQPKGITFQTIAAANNIDLNNPIITPGQKLIIK